MNYSAREVQAAYRMGLTGLGKFLSKSCIIYKTDIGCGSVEPYFNIYHHILYINHVSSYIIYKPYLRSKQLELLTCCAHVPVRKGTRVHSVPAITACWGHYSTLSTNPNLCRIDLRLARKFSALNHRKTSGRGFPASPPGSHALFCSPCTSRPARRVDSTLRTCHSYTPLGMAIHCG